MKRKANEEYSGRLGGRRAGGAAERSRLTVQKCRFGNSCPLARSPPLISSPCSFSQPLISQAREGGKGGGKLLSFCLFFCPLFRQPL